MISDQKGRDFEGNAAPHREPHIFKWAVLSQHPTKEEVLKEIARLEVLKADQANMDNALKININSSYGVLGLPSFICYNRDVAQTITMQSENLLKTTKDYFNHYFNNVLIEKEDLLKELGIFERPTITNTRFVNYADTDSVFVQFKQYYELSDKKLDINDWLLKLYNLDLKNYMVDKMKEYCDSFNAFTERPDGTASLILELENICYSVLMTSKKRYIKEISYGKGKRFGRLENLVIKGLEANKSATPSFCRAKLKEMITYIIDKGNGIDGYKLSVMMKNIKEQFKKVNIEEVCKTERINDYNKNVLNDTTYLEFYSGATTAAKGAGYYNYELSRADNVVKSKYPRIYSGSKVRWYYIMNPSNLVETFSFMPDFYPAEFAPPIDYDLQFDKTFLTPLNIILNSMGVKQVDPDFVYFDSMGW